MSVRGEGTPRVRTEMMRCLGTGQGHGVSGPGWDTASQDGEGRALVVPWGPSGLGVGRAGRGGRKASRTHVRAGPCPA